jgi:threonine dehydrogenase-like Zn-dependent dehydrogenase
MKAVVYCGPRDVRVEDVPDPKIEEPTDVLVKIRSTNICGSDLHMYEGRTDVQPGTILGHEPLGEVIEVGKAVTRVKVGDWVCLPFNISCGTCKNCEAKLTGFCLRLNPGHAGAAYGYADMGPYPGGQAEYLRVPFGDFNALILPADAKDRQNDYVMLSDIFPTGYHATELAGLRPGESVVIFGAGPVGLMAALSAQLKGADQIFVVDRLPDRLRLAAQLGATPIDYGKGPAEEQVLALTHGAGADRGCECVGFQATDAQGVEHPDMTMTALARCVRATGGIGVVGVFVPRDPGARDPLAREGRIAFDYGLLWSKGQHLGTGQANVKAYNRELLRLIVSGRALPSAIVSHQLPLDAAPDAYKHFDARDHGWTKVVLKP